MASWLKVAEDLLEVVDRRAKLVVSELSDEQLGSQATVPNSHEAQAKRTRSKEKGQLRRTTSDAPKSPKSINLVKEQESIKLLAQDVKSDELETAPAESSVDTATDFAAETKVELPSNEKKDAPEVDHVSLGIEENKDVNDINSAIEVPITENQTETASPITDDITNSNPKDMLESSLPLLVMSEGVETSIGDHSSDVNPKSNTASEETSLTVDQENSQSHTIEKHSDSSVDESSKDTFPEALPSIKKQPELKASASHMKVQDQLDEAQGLLKAAISTGKSKEARLARVCAGLSSRLQEYKSENAQLEELLVSERELSSSNEARIKQLQQDLSASKMEVARVESSMAAALAAKNSEIEALAGSLDTLKKQAASSEGKLASLQVHMEEIMRGRELTETRMMQALREELASTERRFEEERAAHNATKMAAVEREVELEHRAVEASNALARFQRTADESTSRATELEHKVALLEVECSSLNQELQEMESRTRRGQKKTSEEANQILQMQAWQDEVERARQGQRDAEHKLSSLEAELQKMRVEVSGMKRDAEHYSRQEHMELEKRYRELTDLLYHKQTQLEAMASEKAALEFQLEKELKRFQEAQVEAERSRASRRASSGWEEDTDLTALGPLPLHHRHMAAASVQLQRAAKLLDSGAVRATRFLWRYPVARIILLFYLVFVHLFLMYLLHHLQEQAADFASKETAAFMGRGNTSLP